MGIYIDFCIFIYMIKICIYTNIFVYINISTLNNLRCLFLFGSNNTF